MILRLSKFLVPLQWNIVSKAAYAETASGTLGGLAKAKVNKKVKGGVGGVSDKKVFPAETDAKKLVKYVCGSNILKEGGENIELKPDSEYPEWLWTLRTGPAPKLEELDPSTKYYWLRLRKEARRQTNQLAKMRRF
uniref:Large ribosomal subunit protein mL54 n=1 Tax=Cacopsylla melanoneura TaxID=428564 RepID=A0A8D8WR35_9HEMI